jgi:uncharacterized delta-60 repeat protein
MKHTNSLLTLAAFVCNDWRRRNKAALLLFSVALLLMGGAVAMRGQTVVDGFDPNVNGATIFVVVVQPDGKILIGGDFTTVSPNGGAAVTRNRIARLNPDGTLDTVFNPNANNAVRSIAVQPDGKIVVGGDFSSIGGQTRNCIARLDATTGLADSFDPNASAGIYASGVFTIALQADGNILAGGSFTTIGGQTRNHIARLDATTGLADSFNPNANNYVRSIVVQTDGKILVGGDFNTVSGTPTIGGQARNSIARLDATTGLADSFDPHPPADFNSIVSSVVVQPDGKILIGGAFITVSPNGGAAVTRNRIARLNPDGTLDTVFNPNANSDVYVIAVQADGKILVGGLFLGANSIGGQTRNRIARLDATTGSPDSFDPNANNIVRSIAVQPDGKILVGGQFTTLAPDGGGAVTRNRIARLGSGTSPGIVLIAGGDDFSLYGNNAGNLWAMGDNYAGQLGDGTNNNIITVPELIVAGAGTALAAGNDHTLVIKNGGSLWVIGDNTDGQLGDGTYNPTNLPELIVSNNVTAVAAGFFHSVFVKSDGSLWSMGDNSFGQLGDGTYNQTNRPEMVVPSGVTTVSAGYRHNLFLKSDGSLWGIGGNNYGQLGDGTGNNATVPERLLASNVTAVAAGGLHSLFIKSDGSLWAMGDNEDGELGDGTGNYETNQPEMIVPSGVTAVAAGFYHSLFLKSDGSLWSMGLNNNGQLGDGTFDPTNRPQLIVSNNVTAIAAGWYHSLFIKSDGSLWAMGFDEYGELGDGQLNNTNSPELLVAGIVANGGIPFFTKPMFTNGYFQATLNGMALSNYVVYVSSNLVNWTTLKSVTTTAGGSTNVTDTSGTVKLRFYRARLGP